MADRKMRIRVIVLFDVVVQADERATTDEIEGELGAAIEDVEFVSDNEAISIENSSYSRFFHVLDSR